MANLIIDVVKGPGSCTVKITLDCRSGGQLAAVNQLLDPKVQDYCKTQGKKSLECYQPCRPHVRIWRHMLLRTWSKMWVPAPLVSHSSLPGV